MEIYANASKKSGVYSFEIGSNYILVKFISDVVYEYTYSSAGVSNVEKMKIYAIAGSGLYSFIQQHVKDKYSRKLK